MTYEEYLELVARVAAKNIKPNSKYITAASLGALVRQAAPEVTWKSFGRRSLSELLEDLEQRQKVRLMRTEKDALAIEPIVTAAEQVRATPVFNPLRKAVWDAFVLPAPAGKRFMHRGSSIVRAGIDVPPAPADEWVEIRPVPAESQREWAREFFNQSDIGSLEARQTLDLPNWQPHAFVNALRNHDEIVARQWNRFRSAKVSSVVQAWLTEHQLPSESVFESAAHRPQGEATKHAFGSQAGQVLQPDEARQVILAALAMLPLEKLEELSIPAGVLLSAVAKVQAR